MSILRIGGMASGFDTEQIVRDLMRVERFKVDKLFQQRQVIQWQKQQYRSIINKVRIFRDDYFNVTKPASNLMSATALKKMTVTSSDPSIVTTTAGSAAMVGESTFQVIQSATAAKATVSGVTVGSVEGNRLNLNETMETISGSLAGGELDFDENNEFILKINGEDIIVNKDDTLRTVVNRINSSNAGVQVSYSSFSDSLTVINKATGEGFITTDDGGNFFTAFGLVPNGEGEIGEAGRDAIFEINGFRGSRSTNTFTVDGITYSINKKIDEADNSPLVTLTTAIDTEGIYQTIVKFIDDYNSLIDTIRAKLTEERFRDFPPLTDEQKEAMSEKEIEKWEEKAQSGLLRRDSALDSMLSNMRRALYEAVGDFHLTEIGIETSNNYRDNGKLVLKGEGSVLRAAIANNPDKVAEIFSKRSEINYSPNLTAEQRRQRFQESGIAHRLSDILNDNIRTSRDSSGRKGILLEQAGIEGDLSNINNFYDRQINHVNKRIDRMNEMLQRTEDQYYRQFAAMEKALQKLYSQGDWLMMQLNAGR